MAALTPKQEAFCQAYIETGNASEAYRRAYPKALNWAPSSVWAKASNLLATDKVRARVGELQSAAAANHEVTVESIARELDAAAKDAREFKQAGAIVAALMGKAKLYGLVINKHEQVNELTDEQRDRRIQQLLDERERARAAEAARGTEAVTRH